ncbi:T9SS type A sorting domain-containing protein [bacterium]|nr:T9SS type A sorting domain-containing protein [bacterium]
MKYASLMSIILMLCVHAVSGGTLVMITSDYQTGNTAVFSTETGILSDNVLPVFQDSRVKTDGTYLYILEGFGADAVSKYNPASISGNDRIYQYSVGAKSNPRDIVFFESKAYLLLYGTDRILVVDPAAKTEASFKKGEIDISPWADADGSPEACMGFVYKGRVYVVLQRYDMSQYAAGTAVLLAIDPATDSIVDMDTAAEGVQGIELAIKNPQSCSLTGDTLYLAGTTYGISDEGVWKLDLANPSATQQKLVSEADAGGSISGVATFSAGYGLVLLFDESWNTVAREFNYNDGTLGEKLPVPGAGGGVVMSGGLLYVGSTDSEKPGLYVLSPFTDENPPRLDYYPTELPPYSMVYTGKETPTDVAGADSTPETFTVGAAYPNPFNPQTSVSFTLAEPGVIRIDVFNSAGQRVDTLTDTFMGAGTYMVGWNAVSLSSGMYYIRVTDGNFARTVKATLIK